MKIGFLPVFFFSDRGCLNSLLKIQGNHSILKGGITMKEQLQALLELQNCDLELKSLEKKLSQQEKAHAIFEQNKHKDELKVKITKLVDNLAVVENSLTQLDRELEELTAKSTETSKTLYDGHEQDAKQLVNLQENLTTLTGNIEEKETKYYTLLEEKEEILRDITGYKKERQELKKTITKDIEDFKEGRAKLLAEKERLTSCRNKLEKLIDKDLLTRYNQKQGTKLVVLVTDGNCGYCGVKVNFEQIRTLKTYASLERCEYCGKLLYFPEN